MCVCVRPCVRVYVYVRVSVLGARLQDDAAENPLVAAELGLPPHLELYWKNKLMVSVCSVCCSPGTTCVHNTVQHTRMHCHC